MSNPSKESGTKGETRVRKDLESHGFKSWRRALAGSNDEGDLGMILPDGTEVTLEIKSGRQTKDYKRCDIEDWKQQTLDESENSGCPAVLIIPIYRKELRNAHVWMPNSQWGGRADNKGWTLMYYDEFIREMGGE